MELFINCFIFLLSIASILYSALPHVHETKIIDEAIYTEIHVYSFKISSPISTRIYAFNRVLSLERALNSVISKDLDSSFEILIDGGHPLRVYEKAKGFIESKLRVKKNQANFGVPETLLYTWHPTSHFQSLLMVEDDVELSKYHWKYVHLCLNSVKGKWSIALIGCSLYKPIVNELSYESKNEWNPIRFNANIFVRDQRYPYLTFQLPSSWGSVYSGLPWAKLQTYFRLRQLSKHLHSVVPNSRSNDWDKSWKKYLIEMNFICNWFLLYPVLGKYSLSTNYFENGVHTRETSKHESFKESVKSHDYRFSVPLLDYHSRALDKRVNVSELQMLDVYHQPLQDTTSLKKIVNTKNSWKKLCNIYKEVYAS